MNRLFLFLVLAVCFCAGVTSLPAAQLPAPVRVLIIDGQNNHAWATTTPILKRILEQTGRCRVDVSTTPPSKPVAPRLPANATEAQRAAHAAKLAEVAAAEAEHQRRAPEAWAKWRPAFASYQVVLSNYNGERWPEEVRTAFVAFVRGGGGFVAYHAANNSFPDWPEYNAMIGVGGWGGRNEKSGPYLRFRDGRWTRDPSPGPGGSHGPQHEFLVEVRDPAHPIVRGLPARWKHTKDELYDSLRGPAENVTVLASAFSAKSGQHEPLLMTVEFGRGRVFHNALGHGVEAVHGVGFQVTLARGVEWAATGDVTLPAPTAGILMEDRAATQAEVR